MAGGSSITEVEFVGPTDSPTPEDCSEAVRYEMMNSGELFSEAGQISTDEGVAYQRFMAGPPVPGSISTTIRNENGTLVWRNAAFANGMASFCREPGNDQIWTVFNGVPPPFDCMPIEYIVHCGKYFFLPFQLPSGRPRLCPILIAVSF